MSNDNNQGEEEIPPAQEQLAERYNTLEQTGGSTHEEGQNEHAAPKVHKMVRRD